MEIYLCQVEVVIIGHKIWKFKHSFFPVNTDRNISGCSVCSQLNINFSYFSFQIITFNKEKQHYAIMISVIQLAIDVDFGLKRVFWKLKLKHNCSGWSFCIHIIKLGRSTDTQCKSNTLQVKVLYEKSWGLKY